ncbi:MAG: hypothetical protein AAF623_05230, partial [Planctomycetota bacterium]
MLSPRVWSARLTNPCKYLVLGGVGCGFAGDLPEVNTKVFFHLLQPIKPMTSFYKQYRNRPRQVQL